MKMNVKIIFLPAIFFINIKLYKELFLYLNIMIQDEKDEK